MNLVILDGSDSNCDASRYLVALATNMGAQVTRYPLAELRVAPCTGDFDCWIKTPGMCRTRDEAQSIARAMHHADLAIFLTPVVFGGYSAELKKALDRLISLAHPYFNERDGLTRHEARYDRYVPLLFLGLTEQVDNESADIFREMAAGNAINLMAPTFHTQLIAVDAPDWQQTLENTLRTALGGGSGQAFPASPKEEVLYQACGADTFAEDDRAAPRSAAIFIGSARPKGTSTSESLARQLIDGLEADGVRTTLVYASQFIKPGRAATEALEAMLAAELLVVSSPIYVDGLPALATRALQQLAERLADGPHPLRKIVGLLNCGYPEAIHNRITMRLLRTFARQNGLLWAGGLALGGGEIIHGRPLASARLMARAPIRALDQAAQALATGHPIPPEAIRLMARPLISSRLFRWIARLRWITQALPNGIGWWKLGARPHETSS